MLKEQIDNFLHKQGIYRLAETIYVFVVVISFFTMLIYFFSGNFLKGIFYLVVYLLSIFLKLKISTILDSKSVKREIDDVLEAKKDEKGVYNIEEGK